MKKLTPAEDFATRPIELPATVHASARMCSSRSPSCVEHGWETASRHATSLGTVVYSVCASCGTHRAELLKPAALFPAPISREIVGRRSGV